MTTHRESVYDISLPLNGETVTYPGDTPYERRVVQSLEGGDGCTLSALTLSAHAGTHVDVPAHFVPGGRTVDQYAAADFILPARVVDVDAASTVTPAHLDAAALVRGGALLLRTRNSLSGRLQRETFSPRFVHLSPAAARACAAAGLALVGIDAVSVEPVGGNAFEVHRELLSAGVLILEGIHLSHVPAGRYRLVCLPLKMEGAEASPVRAVLIGGL